MTADESVSVRFWGVRGSIACPGPATVAYGGNTSCVEVLCGDDRVILDAGSGIMPLGLSFAPGVPVDADILLSHTHFDHIVGLPFFGPAYVPGNTLRMWAGHLEPKDGGLENVLCGMMTAPLFPVPMGVMASDKTFNDFKAGDSFELGCGAVVKTCPLNHPNGATAYRIEYGRGAICYVTDTEHVPGELDENILGLIEGADVFIYDATYTDDEYPAHQGWGHSTWQEGAKLAEAAGVKTYVPFHHDPSHTDTVMSRIEAEARERFEDTIVAREGLVLEV
ncbi:MAG: MBL fold metallo-hydrolase [Alphaproteobacteria bacterium]|nr:MBL fold metallo-hydrolase [Alphaproteobacteria bacterium]